MRTNEKNNPEMPFTRKYLIGNFQYPFSPTNIGTRTDVASSLHSSASPTLTWPVNFPTDLLYLTFCQQEVNEDYSHLIALNQIFAKLFNSF